MGTPTGDDVAPRARLLSNGRYSVLISAAGSGYSAWNGYALSGWAGDRIEDSDGVFVYLRDLDRGAVWSAGLQPTRRAPESYSVICDPGRVGIERRDDDITTRLEVCVAPDADVEIRRVRLHNLSAVPRRLEVTTFAEVVLNAAAAHAAHPAFSKLFVQTEFVESDAVLLARRRPRSQAEQHPWMVHALVVPPSQRHVDDGPVQYETDRVRFLGRGRTAAAPQALSLPRLAATAGNVLDPIFSLRRVVELGPGERVDLTLLLGAAPTREAALDLVRTYDAAGAIDAVFARAAVEEGEDVRRLGIPAARAVYFQELAGAMLYGHPGLRAGTEVIRRAGSPLSAPGVPIFVEPMVPAIARRHGLSGDGVLAVVDVERADEFGIVEELAKAQAYWQLMGLPVELLIVCAEPASLADDIRRRLVAGEGEDGGLKPAATRPDGPPGTIAVRRRAEMPASDLDVLLAAAHLVVAGALPAIAPVAAGFSPPSSGSAQAPVGWAPPTKTADTGRSTTLGSVGGAHPTESSPLLFDNGYGGFSPDGSEYIIRLEPGGRRPPMPWINVVANEHFGFLVSESGAGYTWSRNSREHRLTPWFNDPVSDPYGEALYLRDDETGAVWSPLPGPAPGGAPYEVRHGFGYSCWRHSSHQLLQEVWLFVSRNDPVKLARVRLVNDSDRPRRLSFVAYQRLVLGGLPAETGRFVVSEIDEPTGVLLARNRFGQEFSDGVVCAAAVPPAAVQAVSLTADRSAFIGRNGCAAAPAALRYARALDGRAGAGLDPCAAICVTVLVAAHAEVECTFLLGEATSDAAAATLVERYRRPGAVDAALREVRDFWTDTLSAVRVETPSPSIDVMLNGWLLYQTLSCRLWGRSAFYQSGGAFGFRDQLQDSAALVHARPDFTRAQIVLHAAHQFVEGDVLHWWHPPLGRGTRTRFSDDLLWLPFITAFYIRTTGDWSVLDAQAGFVTARPLEPGEDEAYLLPVASGETADVYTHCCLALGRSLTRGAHGLPLMGTGDWNDGMNRVGREGRGESVWMGFFLHRILDDFIPVCERRGERERVSRYRAYQSEVKAALDNAGWDGAWYRRAYYDDGTPLGSAQNDECRIDALAQAWAVISHVASPERAVRAMDAVEQQLVSKDAGLIRLLAPPFDRDPHDPGYIKGYVPGIRENGGQYTHAAIWVVQALAELGWRDRAAAYLEMLGPVHHARTPEDVATYHVEPYVVAADIYGVEPHVGRGGWTWYTGSAAWMYRVALESVLGVRIENGDTLLVQPCVPDAWPQFRVQLRLSDRQTRYEITVRNPNGAAGAVRSVIVDGRPGIVQDGAARVALAADGAAHRVEVMLGEAPSIDQNGS